MSKKNETYEHGQTSYNLPGTAQEERDDWRAGNTEQKEKRITTAEDE